MLSKNPGRVLNSPKFGEWRPNQREATERILQGFSAGRRFSGLSAPTGSGKSLIAMMVAAGNHWPGQNNRTILLTQSRQLQDQYANDFRNFAVDFRGKSNYGCPLGEKLGISPSAPRPCHDTQRKITPGQARTARTIWPITGFIGLDKCPVRALGECQYYLQKDRTLNRGTVTVTNYANYLMLKRTDGTGLSPTTLILDEAHNLDDIIEGHTELTLEPRDLRELGIAPPPEYNRKDGNPEEQEWSAWKPVIGRCGQNAELFLAEDDRDGADMEPRNRERTQRLSEIAYRAQGLASSEQDVNVRYERSGRSGAWKFRAAHPGMLAERLLYEGTPNIVLMSATLERTSLSGMGVKAKTEEWIELPSTFPPELSPIRCGRNVRAKYLFNFKEEQEEGQRERWVAHIDKLLDQAEQKENRTLLVVPAERQLRYIERFSRHRDKIVFHWRGDQEETKAQAVERFRRTKGWGVLAGAFDMAEGHSFDGAVVETTIIPKLWYPPDFRERINRIRVKEDPKYNERRKARWLAQVCGRATRSETDRNEVIISDANTEAWLKPVLPLLPQQRARVTTE